MNKVTTWWRDFRDLLSPRYCAICGKHLNPCEEKLCTSCLLQLPYLSIQDYLDNDVSRVFWGKLPVEQCSSFIRYGADDEIHRLVHQLKYRHRPDLGRWLGRQMALKLQREGFFEGIECIIPVPLHWRRRLKRGYNQSEQLALGVSQITGLPVLTGYVRRVRNNKTQTHMSHSERIENVKDLFWVRRPIPYLHVLLVDDVITTGATMLSFAESIVASKPDVRISILSLAKT